VVTPAVIDRRYKKAVVPLALRPFSFKPPAV
jgi:hypothetical protein